MPEPQEKSNLLSRAVNFLQRGALRVQEAGGLSSVLQRGAENLVPGLREANRADELFRRRYPEQYAEIEESLRPENLYGPGNLSLGTVLKVHPKSFLRKTKHPEASMNVKRIEEYRQMLRAGKTWDEIGTPELHVDEAGNVIGADGRHRAAAALQEGLTEIPVKRSVRREVPAEGGGTVYVLEDMPKATSIQAPAKPSRFR